MTEETIAHPAVATQAEWLRARRELLLHEKELTRQYDRVNAERRRLPMVGIEKTYSFEGPVPGRHCSLLDLFEGQRQLIIYHFMFDPEWEKGCGGCTSMVNSLGNLSSLAKRNTTYALVSRAPLSTLLPYKDKLGWRVPWYSSFGSDFNYDFNVTHDATKAPVEYNYRNEAELKEQGYGNLEGEDHGLSVFFQLDGKVYHTYSSYARGVEQLNDVYALLDVTPYGRQEDFEDSPAGWPQEPTYG